MSVWKLLPLGALALTAGLAPAEAAPAGQTVASSLIQSASATDSGVTQVRYRHRGHRFGRGVGIGLGVGILGAIIAAQAHRPRRGTYNDDEVYDGPYYAPSGYQGDPRALCAQSFRSFEWRTGLYTTYGGDKRLCPYLR